MTAQRTPTASPLPPLLALLGGAAFAACQWLVFCYAPVEATLGLAQKIFYIHLPMSWWALISFFVLFLASLASLLKNSEAADRLCAAAAEIGVLLGGISGYFGGWIDMAIMRIAEVVSGLPFLPFAMILSAIIGTQISVEQRMYLIMVVLGVLSWPSTCRLVRAQIFSQREQEYVTAAKAMGVREGSIVFRHILPNVLSLILVTATLDFATCMLTESTLSYLGFGISPPTPTWGNMLTGANNSVVIQQYWWRWAFPAAIFGICTICINLIGDALRDAFDPKSAER